MTLLNGMDRIQCFVSSIAMAASGYGIWLVLGGDMRKVWMMYIVPLLIFNGWITLVTYLQVRLVSQLDIANKWVQRCEEDEGEKGGMVVI